MHSSFLGTGGILTGMSDVLLTNLFFTITAVAVIVVTILIAIGLYYVIGILRAVRDIAERVREGSELIAGDAAQLREEILSGSIFSALYAKAAGIAGFGVARRARRKKKPEKEETHTEDITEEHTDE